MESMVLLFAPAAWWQYSPFWLCSLFHSQNMAIEKATANHSPVLAVYAARLDLLVNWIGPLFFIFPLCPPINPFFTLTPHIPLFCSSHLFFSSSSLLLLITFSLFFSLHSLYTHVHTRLTLRCLFSLFVFYILYLYTWLSSPLLSFCNTDMEKQASLFDTNYNVHPLHESHHPLRRPSPSSSESCSLSSTPGPTNQDEAGLCSVFDKLKVDDFGERR